MISGVSRTPDGRPAFESMSGCCCGKPPGPDPEREKTGPPETGNAGSCCGGGQETEAAASCCGGGGGGIDGLLWGSLFLMLAGVAGHFIGGGPGWWQTYSHGVVELAMKAWWGIGIGIIAVGVLSHVPRELVAGLLGRGGSIGGILRATFAGTLLDLCNHGILMVGMQLYRKGASLGQTIAFLVASPWNSLSLTLILTGLIGWKWTLAFVALSMLVGVLAGWLADGLVKRGRLPANPNTVEIRGDRPWREDLREVLRHLRPGGGRMRGLLAVGLRESRMILRWIFFGFVMAAAIRALVPADFFGHYFGPTLMGLLLTLGATTVIEVCSEGSSPIAADLLNRAGAPGNAFTFLMAGAATDYTEILALRETTRSWKATLALPLLTTPQVLVIAWLLNR